MSQFLRKTMTSTTFVVSSVIVASFLSYLVRIILARNLSLEEYGLFYAVFALVSFLLFFRGMGTGNALVKYLSEFKSQGRFDYIKTSIFSVFTLQLFFSFILSVVIYLLSDFLAQNYFKNPMASVLLKLFALYILFSAVFKLLRSIFQGLQRFRIFSYMEPIRLVLVVISLFFLLHFGLGVLSPLLAFILSWALTSLIFLPVVLKSFNFFKYKTRNFLGISRKMLLFGLPLIFVGIGDKVISRSDTLILTYFSGLEQVGIYNVILPTSMMFLFLGGSISSIIFPVTSGMWASKLKHELSKILNLAYKYSLIIILPLLLTAAVYSEFLISFLFGPDYVPGALAFRILLCGVLFYTLALMNNSVLYGIGKPRITLNILIFATIFNIVFNIILIPILGIVGAALSTSSSYLLIFLANSFYLNRLRLSTSRFRIFFKVLVGSLLFVLFLTLFKNLTDFYVWAEIIGGFILSFVIYLSYLVYTKTITYVELRNVLRN